MFPSKNVFDVYITNILYILLQKTCSSTRLYLFTKLPKPSVPAIIVKDMPSLKAQVGF